VRVRRPLSRTVSVLPDIVPIAARCSGVGGMDVMLP